MICSGEWFGAQALNAIRHRMGSRHAIDMTSARRLAQDGSGAARPERAESRATTSFSLMIAADRKLEAVGPKLK